MIKLPLLYVIIMLEPFQGHLHTAYVALRDKPLVPRHNKCPVSVERSKLLAAGLTDNLGSLDVFISSDLRPQLGIIREVDVRNELLLRTYPIFSCRLSTIHQRKQRLSFCGEHTGVVGKPFDH